MVFPIPSLCFKKKGGGRGELRISHFHEGLSYLFIINFIYMYIYTHICTHTHTKLHSPATYSNLYRYNSILNRTELGTMVSDDHHDDHQRTILRRVSYTKEPYTT